MRQHRFIAFASAGSALAATLAVMTTFVVPHSTSTVQAATIFASFKDAVGNAFEINLENIGAEGIQVDGKVIVVFEPNDQNANLFQSQPQGAYVQLRALAGDNADEDVRGLDVDVTVSRRPGQ